MTKEKTLRLDKKKITAVERSLIVLVFYYFGDDSISEEVAGFSPFMVSPRKNFVFIVSGVLLLCLLFSPLNILIILA